jgi:hypothetical protein
MSELKARVNEYLFNEFGAGSTEFDRARISVDWPFVLAEGGPLHACGKDWQLFRFTDGSEEFYALADGHMTFLPVAGMQAGDIALQLEGTHWIAANEPVGLDTVGGLEADIPSLAERREKTAALANLAAGGAGGIVLEGLYLVRRREYLVLARRADEERAHIVGDRIRLRNIPYAAASPWRRLAVGIGKLVRAGMVR